MLDAEKTETLLEVNNIEVIYNHVILVLKGVSLSVPKGGITALLGGNGAGKTTLVMHMNGILPAMQGEVLKLPLAGAAGGQQAAGGGRRLDECPSRKPHSSSVPTIR